MIAEALLLALALAAPAGPAAAKSTAPADARLAEACKSRPCRRDVDFSLRLADGSSRRFRYPFMPPALQRMYLTVLPGETVEAVAEFKDGRFAGWRAPVAGERQPKVQLRIRLEQAKEGGMLARVENLGSEWVKPKLFYTPSPEDSEGRPTSSCPIGPGMSGFETWPGAFFQLGIIGAELRKASDPMDCK